MEENTGPERKKLILSASDGIVFTPAHHCIVEITSQLPWTFPALAAIASLSLMAQFIL